MAITAGLAAGAIPLLGFGIDSDIELFAASFVIWAAARRRTRPHAQRCLRKSVEHAD